MGFDFENLEVYKKSVKFTEKIYKVTKNFPEEENYGLASQLKRAAVSVASNIAEGSGRYNKKDFAQYLRISRGSIYECVPLLEVALKQSFLPESDYKDLIADCNELAKMLNGLIRSLIKT